MKLYTSCWAPFTYHFAEYRKWFRSISHLSKVWGVQRVELTQYTDSMNTLLLLWNDCRSLHPLKEMITKIRSLIALSWDLEIVANRKALQTADFYLGTSLLHNLQALACLLIVEKNQLTTIKRWKKENENNPIENKKPAGA